MQGKLGHKNCLGGLLGMKALEGWQVIQSQLTKMTKSKWLPHSRRKVLQRQSLPWAKDFKESHRVSFCNFQRIVWFIWSLISAYVSPFSQCLHFLEDSQTNYIECQKMTGPGDQQTPSGRSLSFIHMRGSQEWKKSDCPLTSVDDLKIYLGLILDDANPSKGFFVFFSPQSSLAGACHYWYPIF